LRRSGAFLDFQLRASREFGLHFQSPQLHTGSTARRFFAFLSLHAFPAFRLFAFRSSTINLLKRNA
jgi:hypothetical protein